VSPEIKVPSGKRSVLMEHWRSYGKVISSVESLGVISAAFFMVVISIESNRCVGGQAEPAKLKFATMTYTD
jgi:hypothetical protein